MQDLSENSDEFSISTYHDTAAVYAEISELMRRPPVRLKREAMEHYLDYFTSKCAGSRRITDEAK